MQVLCKTTRNFFQKHKHAIKKNCLNLMYSAQIEKLSPITCGLRRTNIVKLFHISDSLYIVAYRLFYFDLVDLAEMESTIV